MAAFSFQGKDIYYEVHGEGRPLILLNGIMMSCLSWTEFVEPFSADNQLILFDFLDQGRSARLEGEDYNQDIQVEVLRALLDHLALERANLVGISYGGEVAMQFAVKYPEKVERLLLFNTTPCTGPWLGDIGDGWNLAAKDAEAYYLSTIPVIYSPGFYKKHNAWMENRRGLLRTVFGNADFTNAMIRLTNSARSLNVTERLGEITAPTLVVSAAEDYLTPVAEQQEIVRRIPDCSHVILPNCGHASMYEQPALFAALTLGFVNSTKVKFHIV